LDVSYDSRPVYELADGSIDRGDREEDMNIVREYDSHHGKLAGLTRNRWEGERVY
jgi:hypothetical protein